MNEIMAFILGAVYTVMLGHLVYIVVDMKRLKKESKELAKMGDYILEDIQVGKHYIELMDDVTETLNRLDNRLSAIEAKSNKED